MESIKDFGYGRGKSFYYSGVGEQDGSGRGGGCCCSGECMSHFFGIIWGTGVGVGSVVGGGTREGTGYSSIGDREHDASGYGADDGSGNGSGYSYELY